MTQLSHIWWDYKNYTQDIIYALCAIEPSFLYSLNGHNPYNSINPHPCWDDSTCSYPSPIRKGTNVCGHSVIYRKFNSVEWMSEEQKKCKLQKHKLTVICATCIRVGCFLMCHSFRWPNRARWIRFCCYYSWLSFWQWYFIAHWSRRVPLPALGYILGGGCMTLYSIRSVTWGE